MNPKYAVIFKRTKESERIQEVIQQYLTKYERILKCQGDTTYSQALSDIEDEVTT